jgi:L-alanine-DL-glutamate epimerase-like enolase superfamily enzyme
MMSSGRLKSTDARIIGSELYLLPVSTRMPLKFGSETLTTVTCARARVTMRDRAGRVAEGWGESPLSVQWAWPGELSFALRRDAMIEFCRLLARELVAFDCWGHPLESGDAFLRDVLPILTREFNAGESPERWIPQLASLVCCAPFDLAVHDAYGRLHGASIYKTYTAEYLSKDLSELFASAESSPIDFRGLYPSAFMAAKPLTAIPVWHLVGGDDPLTAEDLCGTEPVDDYPVLLSDWIDRDGLQCLKVKLRGHDAAWDVDRMLRTGRLAIEKNVRWLAADFNCGVNDPAYVIDILDKLAVDAPETFRRILYVEQPFSHEVTVGGLDVSEVARRKPLLMDESAHNWELVERGRQLGWTGVALKTCKTQTGAVTSLCWAKAHDMPVMVQDLTNPMIASISHAQLAAHAETMFGLESNAMQFYPEASEIEARVHPGLYRRRHGTITLSTIQGAGFGYRLDEIGRTLPEPSISCGELGEWTRQGLPSLPVGS